MSIIIPKQYRPVHHKVLGTWTVEWMGQRIYTAVSYSDAITLVKNIMRALRRLARSNTVDTAAVAAAVLAYLSAAADPANGFNPVYGTGYP